VQVCPQVNISFCWLQAGQANSMRTTYMAKEKDIERNWYVLDASGIPLGRLASEVARILRGKHKTTYTPHVDTGDYVIVINAGKVVLTGGKAQQKFYYRHSGYPGGIKKIRYDHLLAKKPELALYLAVKRMLPANRLGRAMLKKLRVYAGPDHHHEAQEPAAWQFRPKRVAEQ
jgi:large subunit ribosomal protein L13